MADITREVQDVQPTNYIRPGVQKPSPLSLAAAIGDKAIDLDVALQREKLAKNAEALRTTYETSAVGAVDVQDAVELSASDKKQVDTVASTLAAQEAAVSQGRMSYDEYRVRGERLLRQAISKRPGLAQEFRSVAAQHLGVDVVGASVDVLASYERQALAAQNGEKDKRTEDFKRMRDQLDAVGIVNAHMTDEQVMGAYTANVQAVQEYLKHEATNQVVTTEASTQEAGQKLRRPEATAQFVNAAKKSKLDIYKMFSQSWAAFQTGNPDFMKALPQILTKGKTEVAARVSDLRSAMASGDVDPAVAEKEISGLESLSVMMEELASGKLSADVLKNKLEGTMLFMQNGMLDNENVAVLSSATKLFGPELMTLYMQPGGAFNKEGAIALGETLNNTGSPTTRASKAGTTASSLIISVLDRGGAKSKREMLPAMANTLVNAANAFVEVPTAEFKSDWLTGPNGYLTVVNAHREALTKALDDSQKSELLGSISLAALANYYTLAQSVGKKYPSLKGKLDFNLDPKTGEFVRLKAGSSTDAKTQAALRAYNQAFAGKKVLEVFQSLAGVDAPTARNLLFSGNETYLEAKKKKEVKSATLTGGSTNWWESL